ncbi:hypothetical protein D9M68_700580 [compost metagenome]
MRREVTVKGAKTMLLDGVPATAKLSSFAKGAYLFSGFVQRPLLADLANKDGPTAARRPDVLAFEVASSAGTPSTSNLFLKVLVSLFDQHLHEADCFL